MTNILSKITLTEVGTVGGATAGAFVAGPVGFAIGGLLGFGLSKTWNWAATAGLTKRKPPVLAGPPKPITPPGTPQPPGPVVLPSPPALIPDSLHVSAAVLLTAVMTMSPTQAAFPQCLAFQQAYNATGPSMALATDGKYGPKTQAALQSIMAPAVAPGNFFPSATQVPGPPVPAPAPTTGVTVQDAAAVLVAMGSIPKASDGRVTTFQHAYNAHPVSLKLAEDGKYGPLSQAALQSVLDYVGNGQTAPKNPYGTVGVIPAFPG